MNTIMLNNKKYVIIEQEKFDELQLKAAQKTEPAKKLSLLKGKHMHIK